MRQDRWHWILVFVAGIWMVANGIVGFHPVQIQIYRVGVLALPTWQKFLLYAFLYSLHLLGIWGIFAGAGLFTRKELFRKFAVAFCWAQIGLMCFSIMLDVSHILHFGGPVEIPKQYQLPYSALGKIMSSVYTILILILLTRPITVRLFKGIERPI